MGFRESMQNGFGSAKEKSEATFDKLRKRGGRTAQVVDTSIKAAKGAVNVTSRATAKVMDKTTKLMGLDRYRAELEAALDEALRVIATQEARIARLEEELGDPRT
ncbi:MAG: hypothetical protein FJW09_09655 [Actinobacteria bacterium]|nr:hypothetical protein [Actinomycetota bacterium]